MPQDREEMVFRNVNALVHFPFRWRRWGQKVSFRSKMIPRNLASFTMEMSFRRTSGSGWRPCCRQKWIQDVLCGENETPFSQAHLLIWFKAVCSSLSMSLMFADWHEIWKLSTYMEHLTAKGKQAVIPLIFKTNNVTLKMEPWGTPSSCISGEDKIELIRT